MPTDTDFSGLWIPLITPFHHGKVDTGAISRLVRQQRADGVSGFVVCGSTGEAAALDKEEQKAVLHATLEAAQGVPVVMGVSGYHLAQTVAWIREFAPFPLAGLLVPPRGGRAERGDALISRPLLAGRTPLPRSTR